MTKAYSQIARRYAGALLALADEQGQLDAVARELADFADLIKGSELLAAALTNPLLPRDQLAGALLALADRAGAGRLTRNFLGLVAKNGRARELPAMAAAFAAELATRRGELRAQVTSARPLTQAQEQVLKATLAKSAGAKVQIDPKVDPDILGGLIVRLGSKMIDSSLKTKLHNLKRFLSSTTKGMA